eukprot:jgi/Ulvmu1/7374/UM036_0034.1
MVDGPANGVPAPSDLPDGGHVVLNDPISAAANEVSVRLEFLNRAAVRNAINADADLRTRVDLAIVCMQEPGYFNPALDQLRMFSVDPDTPKEGVVMSILGRCRVPGLIRSRVNRGSRRASGS